MVPTVTLKWTLGMNGGKTMIKTMARIGAAVGLTLATTLVPLGTAHAQDKPCPIGTAGYGYYSHEGYIAVRAEYVHLSEVNRCDNDFWVWVDTRGAGDSACFNLADQKAGRINTYRYQPRWWASLDATSFLKKCTEYGERKTQTLIPPMNGGHSW